jgi:hypothetical protein
MAANIELTDDADNIITSFNFGAINGAAELALKFKVKNLGDSDANSVRLYAQRLNQNDGLDFVALAKDNGGNPGVYTTSELDFGTMAAAAIEIFWAKVTVPLGTTPAGNPRQFDCICEYTGT